MACLYVSEIEDRLANLAERKSLLAIQLYLLKLINDKFKDFIQIFIDGSVTNQGDTVGSGFYVPFINLSIKYKLPAGTSIFSAEA